jgi:hypothetical protein
VPNCVLRVQWCVFGMHWGNGPLEVHSAIDIGALRPAVDEHGT